MSLKEDTAGEERALLSPCPIPAQDQLCCVQTETDTKRHAAQSGFSGATASLGKVLKFSDVLPAEAKAHAVPLRFPILMAYC